MRLLFSSYYSLGQNLSLLIGIKASGNASFNIVIALNNYEKIVFSLNDWHTISSTFPEIKKFFNCEKDIISLQLDNFLILQNTTEREIVFKNLQNWNTIRISKKQFEQIIALQQVISLRIAELQHFDELASEIFQHIVQSVVSKNTSHVTTSEIINHLQLYQPESRIEAEILVFFEKELNKSITELLP